MNKHSKEHIRAVAEALLPGFTPKEQDQKVLIFHFTIPPKSNYKVIFNKAANGEWLFDGYEEDNVTD